MRKLVISRRVLALLGLTASLAVAAYGQHIIDDQGSLGEGWPLVAAFDAKLTELYQVEQSVAFAIPLFALAMVVFAISLRVLLRDRKTDEAPAEGWEAERSNWPPPPGWRRAMLALGGVVAFAGWAFLIRRLVDSRYELSYVWLFFGLLLAVAALVFAIDRLRGASLAPIARLRLWEVGLVAALTGLFIGLMVQDLTNWRYAWLGDDGEFFRVAKQVAMGSDEWNLFSQRGPYGYHPPMSSAYQAVVMRVTSIHIFGWKLASVLIVAVSLPTFYWLLRTLIGSRTAAFGTTIMAFSHYLFGYAHTGYNNIFPIFPTILAFALFFAGRRSSSLLFMFGSGAVAGLGFYTHYSARSIVVILALAVLTMGWSQWREQWRLLVPLAAGFALAVAPIFATEGWNVIEAMRVQSAARTKSEVEMVSWVFESAPRVILAFNFNPYPKHFVSGSLLDEISAVLALLGLGYAFYRVRSEGHRFLLLWFLVAVVTTGLLHPRQVEINSRLHYVLPPMAAFAGLALDRLVVGWSTVSSRRNLESVLAVAVFVLVMPAIFGFNAHRHWVESPQRIQTSATAVVFREVSGPGCNIEGYQSIVWARETAPSIRGIFEIYRWEKRMPLLIRFDEPPDTLSRAIAAGNVSCIVVPGPDSPEAEPVIARLDELARQAGRTVEQATDNSGRTIVLVLRLVAPSATPDAGAGEHAAT